MKLHNLERFVIAGYELRVTPRVPGKFHANVGGFTDGHNYIGASLNEALKYLDHYLEDKQPFSQQQQSRTGD